MKTAVSLFFLIFARAACAAAPASSAFADAAKRYDSGDFTGAAAIYQQLLARRPHDSSLHFNLGNALFKEGKIGRALAQYQRAFDLKPRDGDIRYNLEFALKKVGEELVPSGVPPVLFSIFYLFSQPELAGMQWLLCWAALLAWSAYFFFAGAREKLRTTCLAALAAWAAAGGWWLARKSLEPAERGVIVSSSAEVRSGPGESFGVSFTAPEGRRVQIISESGAWLEIGVLKEGAKGWLPTESVEKL